MGAVRQMMESAGLKALAAAFHESLGAGDHVAVTRTLAADVLVHSPVAGRGHDTAQYAMSRCFADTKDAPARPEPCFCIVDGDTVVSCYWMPQPAQGAPDVAFFWIDAVRFEDGLIVEWWPSVNEMAPTHLTWAAPPAGMRGVGEARTSTSDAKQLAVDFYRYVFDSEDADAVARYVTEHYRQNSGHLPSGRTSLEALVRGMFPGGRRPTPEPMTLAPVVLASEGDIVVHGVQLWQRTPDSESIYPYIVFDAYRVEDGQLAEHWSGVNPAAPPVHDGPAVGAAPAMAEDS